MSLEAAIYNEARKARIAAEASSGRSIWSSGDTVLQWQEVRSPLDGEVYMRRTTTGGGTVDPADDLTNYSSVSYNRTPTLSSELIGPSTSTWGMQAAYFAMGAIKPTFPAAATGVRTLVLSLTGRGRVDFIGMWRALPGDARFEIVVDGRTILNKVTKYTGQCGAVYFGAAAGGYFASTNTALTTIIPDHTGIQFRRTLRIYVTPVTEVLTGSDYLAYVLRSVV